ncbi:TIGR03620 family F420-dependent LLM class oxidoreductase [Nonomuraea sp. NPDC049784]|uniref:TIGR03620 family F420-dependent LLM class oxidoreductase n=1 Tax=Nonomuraea sp. NPDC049784 TaxID=3154361 RepID=UPI0033D943CF
MITEVKAKLGPVGVWLGGPHLRGTPIESWRHAVGRVEHLGYGSLWGPEGIGGKDALANGAIQLAASSRLMIGTGIANIWARHPATMQGGAATLAEAYAGRFVLGLGVSQRSLVEANGQDYSHPLKIMRDYLDEMDLATTRNPPPEPFVRVLAALQPKMVQLARDRTDGVHSFSAPVEHTALVREALGSDKLLIPEQAFIIEPDPEQARAIARRYRGKINPDSPYTRNWLRLGYSQEDIADGGSDRLIDGLVAWGTPDAIAERVQAQLDAGADHVLVHPLTDDLPTAVKQLEQLASALPRGLV